MTGVVSVASDSDEAEIQFEVRLHSNRSLHILGTNPSVQGADPPWLMHMQCRKTSFHSTALSLHPSMYAQAFQVSDQAVRLRRGGWFKPQEQPCGESKLRNPKVYLIRLLVSMRPGTLVK